MANFFKIIALIFGILGLLCIALILQGLLTDGFSDGKGMALVLFQFWAVIAALISLILGMIGYLIERKKTGHMTSLTKTVFFCAGLTLLALAAMMIFG